MSADRSAPQSPAPPTEPAALSAGHGLPLVMKILLLAVAYYLTGRLGLLLAIPPGYATAVWPPSGIALAALLLLGNRVWPGIWLGSFLINVWTALDISSASAFGESVLLPATIALGAAAQALLGALVIRRYVGYHNILEQEFDVVRMLALGGPVACLTAASVGVGVLWLSGAIGDDQVLFNWWTWWVGDSIGVLIFAPAILVWSVRPFSVWLRQQLAITLPLLLLFALVVAVFMGTSAREQARVKSEFEAVSDQAAQFLRTDLDRYEVALSSVAGLFSSSQEVTPQEFDTFASALLQRLPGLYAISWNAVVSERDRLSFEAAMRARGYPDFRIVDVDAEGRRVPSAKRDPHVVVTYISYADAATGAQGLDVEFDSARSEANRRAAATRRSTATALVRLIGDIGGEQGLLLNLPVFGRDDQLRGFATLVIRHRNLFEKAIERSARAGIELGVVDLSAPAPQQVFGQSQPPTLGDLTYALPLEVGQRQWSLQYRLPASYMVAHRSWEAWLVLAGGMLLTALLGMLLLVLVGRAAKIEGRVAERTLQLRASEERFRGLVESAPDAMVIVGSQGRISLVNTQTEKLFGYTRDDLVGRPVEFLIPERFHYEHVAHRDGYIGAPRARAMGEGRALFGRRKDGSEFPLEISLSPLRVGDEVIVTSAIRDITARKRAEAELNNTLSVLTATLESTADGILVVDLKGRIVSYNRQFLEMWRIPEVIAQTHEERLVLASVLPQLRAPEAFMSSIRELYDDPEAEHSDLLEFRDGKVFERYSRGHRVGGEIVGRVWSFRDVTQRRAAEAALKASEARYRAAEKTQRAIVAGVIDAIISIDDRGIVQSFNPAAERMFGWSAAEMIGRDIRLLSPAQYRDRVDFTQLSDADVARLRRESIGLRRDGSEFPIDLALNRMPHPDRREYVAMVSDISERKSAEAHIQHLAHHDALTKLPNRALLQDRLNMAIVSAERQNRMLGVMMLDLDHFKRINDSLGHHVGDQLLQAVADRLRDCIRKSDTVARMGGDEFVVLLTDVQQRADIERIADNIVRQLSLPMTLDKQELVTTPSIGVCAYPADGRDALTLLKNADTAMYRAKELGRGRHQWFSQDMLRAPEEELALTNALHRALEREEFSLHYQPQVDMEDCSVVGVEALLRWAHPTRGPLGPSSFVFLAEESGVIAPIGEWVLRKACVDVQKLQAQLGRPLTLSVNVSPRQFRQDGIVFSVRRALEESGLEPELLTLEITESLLL
ncbi:MAG TPA: PAS domain S-box protein, partial [Fontimonas sp.]